MVWRPRRKEKDRAPALVEFYADRPLFGGLGGCGPRQAGVRSSGVNVCCDGRAAGRGTAALRARVLDVLAGPDSFGPSCSLRKSYTILAPACARCPIATAACDPNIHVSGCRSQNFCASATAARAAENASPALISVFGDDCEPPLGNNTRTTPSQKAIRNKKRMTYPVSRRLLSAALEGTVAGRLESAVRGDQWFLYKFKANAARIFLKFE